MSHSPASQHIDRTMRISHEEVVRTAWVPIHRVRIETRTPMAVGDIKDKHHLLLNNKGKGVWPPVTGQWVQDSADGAIFFQIIDGRHEFVASLMRSRTHILVAWKSREKISDYWMEMAKFELGEK